MIDKAKFSSAKLPGFSGAASRVIRGAGFAVVGLLLLLVFWSAGQPADGTEPIALRSEPLPFTPKEFFIADVTDAREDRSAVARLIPAASATSPLTAARPVDLKGGAVPALKQYIRQSLPHNPELRPVTVRLKEMRISEMPGEKGRVEGKVTIAMAFDTEREGEQINLVEYRGGARYIRSASQPGVAEPALRQSLAEALKYLNNWMNQEASRNEKLARGIKVSFTDYTQNLAPDTVFYTLDRPLVWDDFRASPTRQSKFAASVFPSFAYEGQSEVVDGYIHLNLTLKVYVLQHSSWVKEGSKDAYGLNHEQRHFDIVKLVAERFKQKVQPDSLTLSDYNSIIQYQFIESYREMNRLQEQYDGETRHGLDKLAQERWNQRIDAELRALGAKK
ncbi:MAG: hypothetical protein LPK07_05000 [Hymenobacteraceae bacterium]|nr:hypothetical protein [Hymenobacteraceae bacterium]